MGATITSWRGRTGTPLSLILLKTRLNLLCGVTWQQPVERHYGVSMSPHIHLWTTSSNQITFVPPPELATGVATNRNLAAANNLRR